MGAVSVTAFFIQSDERRRLDGGVSMMTIVWLLFICATAGVCATAVTAQERPAPLPNERVPGERGDERLVQIAVAQAISGDLSGASETIRQIKTGEARAHAIQGSGGGAFADFQPLMNLIQQTVAPETWEVLGGPSTLAPYPGGIIVDPSGTVRPRHAAEQPRGSEDMVAEIELLLAPAKKPPGAASPSDVAAADERSWRLPSAMRCVSLKRLLAEIVVKQQAGDGLDPAVQHLAGLSRVRFVIIADDDIVLAGRVGGIEQHDGWYRDRETGRVPLSTEALAVCLASAIDGRPFGCTIDPTAEGLREASQVGTAVAADQIPIGQAAAALASALGQQHVEFFGTAGDTATGYLMLEADRHMKQLALGREEMPEGGRNYLDIVDDAIEQGLPDDRLLRLWFTASPMEFRCDPGKKIFEIAGRPLRLSGQNERALADGRRGVAAVDFRTERFVNEFNRNWTAIRNRYPLYSGLESLYRGASVAELLKRYASASSQRGLLVALALVAGSQPRELAVPQRAGSIAVLHSIRQARQRHHMLIASGGVSIDPGKVLVEHPRSYPPLADLGQHLQPPAAAAQPWWWDAKTTVAP